MERRPAEIVGGTVVNAQDDDRAAKRWLPVAAFAVLALLAAASAFLLKGFVDDQEERLLEERTSEASTLLSSVVDRLTATLPMLGALTEAAPGSEAAVLERLVPDDSPVVIGTAGRDGDDIVVSAIAGEGPAAGEPLAGRRLALVQRAFNADGIVSTVLGAPEAERLLFAVATGDGERAIFQELAFDPDFLSRDDADEPFNELDGAVYAADSVVRDRLVFATTNDLPIDGDVAEEKVGVGADEWTLVAKARRPLVGAFAANAHWYLFAAGLLAAALVTAMLEMVNRRRAYAFRLVDTRTRELEEAREAAEAANLSKSDFLSRMSHELRTPLNAVLGFGQLLELEDLSEKDHEAVKQILRGGRHLLELINEVLDITRIETGTFQLSPEPVLVGDVVDDVAQLTAPLAAQANIQLTNAMEGCDVYVRADRQRLKQVLLNLVSNAIKYNRVGGSVTLSCELIEGDTARVTVSDTGPGIRSEDLDLLFTPFERLGAEQTTVEGTGIGLTLSRRIAEAMGGTLDLETTLGEGSTFWIELPIVEGPVERHTRLHGEAVRSAPSPDAPSRTVLYIEDNVANLRLVESVLAHDTSIDLLCAGQGRPGMDLAREHQPALILLDLHLPDVGGEEVLRMLRADPATASIPIVILSADATPGQIERLRAQGAHSYLTKPFDVTELRKLVDDLPVPAP